MKTTLIYGILFSSAAVAGTALVATVISGDVSEVVSAGFPLALSEALQNGEAIHFDALAPDMVTVCFVLEYNGTVKFLHERGLANPPDLYVGELHALIVLEASNGMTEYRGFPSAIAVSRINGGCGSTQGVVWQPVQTMKIGESTYPIYAQTAGTELK